MTLKQAETPEILIEAWFVIGWSLGDQQMKGPFASQMIAADNQDEMDDFDYSAILGPIPVTYFKQNR